MSTTTTDPDTASVGVQTAQKLGLRPEEYDRIKKILGRTPNFTELSIYSAMWSEHCSYKNSIKQLKTLPRSGPKLLAEAGEENAGLVDIGDGWACAFKIESHNHPSAIEPYQGAATGVGGINRDIFTMGARPIAQLNSLRFGDITKEQSSRWHMRGVVKGIGDYGNAFGVPVLGGEVYFDPCYTTNPLVNAMSVGIVRADKVISATSHGVGNPVFIVGSATGKDGIHGASFASKDISETSTDDLPAVQVGDPFMEKLLLEASLELAQTDAIIGMQDMGAAGITCSTSEMSAKGGAGMDIQLDKVPTRQSGMRSWEILLSESQERMLVVVKKGREAEVQAIFEKWDLNCVEIGTVTKGGNIRFFHGEECVAEVPAESLVLGGGAPVYVRESKEPAYIKENARFDINKIEEPDDLRRVAYDLLASPNIASKRWVSEQYDTMVRTNNMSTNAPSDAGLVLIRETGKGLALTVDCNSRYVFADPYKGAMIAVSEAARNIACTGGEPCGVTNCLNFGNPYDPEVYWQFEQVIKGMGEACRAFDTPVTGGNVSFYNHTVTEKRNIPVFPTPTIGMVGIVPDITKRMSLDLKFKGDLIFLLGQNVEDIACSEYLVRHHGVERSPAPYFDLEEERRLHTMLLILIRKGLINAAHDISEGGLWTTLVEMALPRGLGFDVITDSEIRPDAFLFGEAQGRAIVTVNEDEEIDFLDLMRVSRIPFVLLGHVTKGKLMVDDLPFGTIEDARKVYEEAIPNAMREL
ncbi:MAG TPA: phosphoribosylformylglycinamidine synthase subunit PurL [Flavobacteriales bacterium]|jgi:phosphoribosylformylglycinamidine synthase II|nr:phosphoribosylformylglycinamidine synthase subunit PurL [Flavobacteriales bacterium]MBK7100951.1 phosphoribosylformylglycinamidine synthase subunit PurL [Flavobacteriales bacterium]MBK8532717.1 phosphoribosylformylglycinamidine synthase subunit PurL [Flavobacteriales bacterium]HQW06758.1 phosphoribosylformylglycinamidine synthase subunit PurL [Flavobacteriales bacterium]HQW98812.1 phosphoribosylformylglycinamidine synthase subunit PurL [Flavobacteriales bacterium]